MLSNIRNFLFLSSNKVLKTMKEYKIVIYQEGALSSLIFGAANSNATKFTGFLNDIAKEGWRVVTMQKDIRRLFLFWRREAYLIVMERERSQLG
jgi:hypothetical protein